MLVELYIENFILMDRIQIPFKSGLNVLTGETGAGKSILLGALNLVLGERFHKELIKNSDKKTVVQATFAPTQRAVLLLKDQGLDWEDDILTISRQWQPSGRQTSRINGRIVTISEIRELAETLMHIHGQHEHQILLDASTHLSFVDAYGKLTLEENALEVESLYKDIQNKQVQIQALSVDPVTFQREIDLIKYQVNEIEKADLQPNEDEEVESRLSYLKNFENIHHTIQQIQEYLSGDGGISSQLGVSFTKIQQIKNFDSLIDSLSNRLESVYYEIESIREDVRDYADTVSYDEENLSELEARLNLINDLKRKYGRSLEDINQFYNGLSERLSLLSTQDKRLENLKIELRKKEEAFDQCAKVLSSKRQQVAKAFEKQLMEEIHALNMKEAQFSVSIVPTEQRKKTGIDQISFLISTNEGQKLSPLKKVISGGELSRMMLGIKRILGKNEETNSLVFDEIDTGISGKTAHVVADKLDDISRDCQVICVTHLPQIAAMADHHLFIQKKQEECSTFSSVEVLSEERKILEIGRLSGGDMSQAVTKKHAQMLKEQAEQKKKKKGNGYIDHLKGDLS